MPDYIPAEDNGFRTWAEAFAGGISSNPSLYMLTPANAVSIQGVVDDFVAKLAVSSNEATRTKATIIQKDDSRAVAETLCRQYAILIKENAGISDAAKVNIGVRPVNPS